MGKKAKLITTPATLALGQAGVAFTEHPYEHDARATDYGAESSRALGADPRRVFKTLMATGGSGASTDFVVALVPVSAHLDLKALGSAVGLKKLAMADPAAAQRRSGYVLGGISPLGQRQHSPTFIDASAEEWQTIFVSGGRRGLSLEIAPRDLAAVTGARFAPIAAA